MKKMIFLFVVCFASTSFAGFRVGNGGDAVVCPGKVHLMDLYEGEKFGVRFIEGDASEKILSERLEILEKISDELGRTLKTRRSEFEKSHKLVSDPLVDVEDSLHTVKPSCKDGKIEQIALRVKGATAPEPKWLLNEELWKKMSERDRAGLILHEIVYEHFNGALGEQNSVKVRRFVRFVMSKDFSVADKEAFWKFVGDQKLPIYR